MQLHGLIPKKKFIKKVKFDPNYVEAKDRVPVESHVMGTKGEEIESEIPHELDSLIPKAKEKIQKWKRNLKQLYLFSFGRTTEKKIIQTSEESTSKCEMTLEESEINQIIEQVKASYKCLESRYQYFDKVKTPSTHKDEFKLDVFEIIGLYEYLLISLDKTHEKVFTDKMEPLQKQRIQKLKETLEKVKNHRLICSKFLTLPSVLDIDFDSGVPLKIQTFIDKFDDPHTSIGEVLQYFKQLHPSLQSLTQEKIRFVEQVCADEKPKSKIND